MDEIVVPARLPVLPLKNTVDFPQMMVPLAVGRPRSLQMLEGLPVVERVIACAAQLDEETEEARWADIHKEGVVARIQHLLKLPDGTAQLAVQGLRRIRLVECLSDDPYTITAAEAYGEEEEIEPGGMDREAVVRTALSTWQQLVAIAPYLPGELLGAAHGIDSPTHLAYFLANHVRLTTAQRQEILEIDSGLEKLSRLLGLMGHELEVLELGRRIQSQAEESIGKSQKEYFLREQLKAIQRELGELDADAAEIQDLRERIAGCGMTPEARREAERELGRLERIPTASPEHSVIRTYLDLLVSLPWSVTTEGQLDVLAARRVLDADHYDLYKVKVITTANTLDTVPPALRDRMETLQLSGYTEEEKVHIASQFLVPKQLDAHGLHRDEVEFTDEALRTIIRQYTREAGVRSLEREIAGVLRRAAADIAEAKAATPVVANLERVRDALGKRRFYDESAERIDRAGVATGLSWTPTGGEIIFVEA